MKIITNFSCNLLHMSPFEPTSIHLKKKISGCLCCNQPHHVSYACCTVSPQCNQSSLQPAVNCYYALPRRGLSAPLSSICWRRREFLWTGDLPVWSLLRYTPVYHSLQPFMSLSTTFFLEGLSYKCSLWEKEKQDPFSAAWDAAKSLHTYSGNKYSSVLVTVGVEHCAGHLHEVCLAAIWVNTHTSSSSCVYLLVGSSKWSNLLFSEYSNKKQRS